MPVLDELVFLHFGALILSLLLVKITKLSLGKFTLLYFVMSALNIVAHELLYPGEFLLGTISSAAAGLIAVVIMSGFSGTRISPANYSTILVFLGLSPWYLNLELVITLVVSTLLISSIYGFVQQFWAFKSLGYNWMPSLKQAENKMKSDDFEKFKIRSNVVFVYPFLISIAATIILVSLS